MKGDDIATAVRAIVARHTGLAPSDDQALAAQQVDSMTLVEVLLTLEQELGIRLRPERMATLRTLHDLIRAVQEERDRPDRRSMAGGAEPPRDG